MAVVINFFDVYDWKEIEASSSHRTTKSSVMFWFAIIDSLSLSIFVVCVHMNSDGQG